MANLPKIAVCGSGNAGLSIAADCALKGFEVSLFELEKLADQIQPIQAAGGIEVTPTSATTSGKTGFVALKKMTTDPAEAVEGADVIMITVPAMYHTEFFDALSPYLRDGQIVLFNTAYWACLRHVNRLASTKAKIILAESNIMPYAAQRDRGNRVHISRYKRVFRVAALPGEKTDHVYSLVKQVYSQFVKASTVLDVDIASGGNPAMTVPMTIPVAGFYFDRYKGGKLYADATAMGSQLMKAYDADREKLSRYLGCEGYESQLDYYTQAYGAVGDDMAQIMRKSNLIDWYATCDYIQQLVDEDLVYSYVPMVRLADSLGVELAGTKAMVEIMGVMLGKDYWSLGPQLADLGLDGLNLTQVRNLVMTGDPNTRT
jgi:opine dehydrogenase